MLTQGDGEAWQANSPRKPKPLRAKAGRKAKSKIRRKRKGK